MSIPELIVIQGLFGFEICNDGVV